jgi:hypothetical protein
MVNYYVYDSSKFSTLLDAIDSKQAFNANAFINIKNDVEIGKLVDFLSDCFGFEVRITREIL